MEELVKALERHSGAPDDHAALRQAAEAWASHTLNTHDGALLRKSLEISAAIADYCNERERIEQGFSGD